MGFDPPLALLVPLQLLHALTFSATHIGAIHFIGRAVPETQAGTAQALYASVTGGIAMGGAMLVAGPLYAAYAGRAYWAMAALAAVALAASLVLLKEKPRSVLASAPELRLGRMHEGALVAQGRRAVARQQQRSVEIDPVGALREQHRGRHGERGRHHAAHHDLEAAARAPQPRAPAPR